MFVPVAGPCSTGALAADAGPQLTVPNPDDRRPGDTARTTHLAGESLTEPTTLVVDLTPLVGADVDLSNASVVVRRTSSGIDTRGAAPTAGLRYPITGGSPAGSTAAGSEALGLYRRGETPTPTPTPVEDGSRSDPTPSTPVTTDGDGPGFGVVTRVVAVALWTAIARASG